MKAKASGSALPAPQHSGRLLLLHQAVHINRTGTGNADPGVEVKPRLIVEPESPDVTVAALRDILVDAPNLFYRGVPVRLATDRSEKSNTVAQVMKPDDLVLLAHQVCRPLVLTGKDEAIDVRLPSLMARMYLGWRGEWRLRPLNGITSAPLLREDGIIVSGSGYDPPTGMWREDVPDLEGLVPEHPRRSKAIRCAQAGDRRALQSMVEKASRPTRLGP